MKSIIKSLLIVVAVAAVAGGATYAYFSSTVTTTGNTLATGTLEVTDISEGWTKTVVFNNLKPGDTIRKWVTLRNTGTLDIASLKVSAKNVQDTNGLLGQIKLSLIGQVTGHGNAYYSPDWTGGATVTPFLTPPSTGVDILGTYFYTAGNPGTIIAPNESDTIILDFSVPTTLENNWQKKSASFDLQFDAEQSHVPTAH